MKPSLLLSLVLAALFYCPFVASATPIAIHNTGTAGSGVDPYYTITVSTDPGVAANSSAYTDVSRAGGWAPAIIGTNWINPSTSGTGGQSFGIYAYTYTTRFDLSGFDPTTAALSGVLQADDTVTLFLNGNQVSAANIGTYTKPTSFFIGSNYGPDFLPGTNTLSFLVNNSGNYATGFDAAISGTAISESPEGGSFAMVFLAGTILSGVGIRRRRNRSAV